MIARFLTNSKNVRKDSVIWNMIGSVLLGTQSVVLLMVLTRTAGLAEAGVFTFAYANANMFLTIGNFGMRYYQVSDTREQFRFRTYYYSRWLTWILMMGVSGVFLLITANLNGYAPHKSVIIYMTIFFKSIDCLEDVFHGRYQQLGRLDVAAKAQSVRLFSALVIFAVMLIVTKDLLISLIIASVYTALCFTVLTLCSYRIVSGSADIHDRKNRTSEDILIGRLMINCLPLFLGSFLSFYIGNAPKYAIDKLLSDEMQACYGFIAMPVFVIGLLNNFIFNPVIHKMSVLWNTGKIKDFMVRVGIQTGVIAAITVICITGGWLLGIPVLSILYGVDLSQYKMEFIVLLAGGGFLGLSGLLNVAITIIRFQKSLAVGYGIIGLLAFLISQPVVEKYQMMGAAVLYLFLMVGLCVLFCLFFLWGVAAESKRLRKAG